MPAHRNQPVRIMNHPAAATPQPRQRDLRLDFFRGLGMFIIFCAHMPGNPWVRWIPARFGASDATEIFVFCSGMASAIAFGTLFRERSWWMGTARVAFRCWQVYWAHIALFMVTVAMIAYFDTLNGDNFYSTRLYTRPFFEDTAAHLMGLMTLRYVPNYFDILPMYLVLLAMMPFIVWLGLKNRWYAFAAMALMWFGAQAGYLQFPGEVRVDSDREWFFNPFGWQLVFFTGFAFMMGWIKRPPFSWWLIGLAVAIIAFNFVFASRFFWPHHPWMYDVRDAIWVLFGKTDQGFIRYTHFLALAYLCWLAAGEGGRRLAGAGVWGGFVRIVRRVGQQSLAVFLAGMVLAQFFGAALDVTGRNALTITAANLAGFALLIATAYICAFFKSQPWRKPPAAAVAPRAAPVAPTAGLSAQPAQ